MGSTIKAAGALALTLSGLAAWTAGGQPLPSAMLFEQGSGISGTYSGGIGSISFGGAGPSAPGATSGNISLSYWIEVLGPANINVPIDFLANGTASANNQKSASVVTATFGSNPSVGACANSGAAHCASNSSFIGRQLYDVPTNVPVEVQLSGNWFSGCCGDGVFGGGQAKGFANSSVSVDPSFALPGYTLQWSADLSPVAVPETSTYALMLGGLGLAVFASRRRDFVERHAARS